MLAALWSPTTSIQVHFVPIQPHTSKEATIETIQHEACASTPATATAETSWEEIETIKNEAYSSISPQAVGEATDDAKITKETGLAANIV